MTRVPITPACWDQRPDGRRGADSAPQHGVCTFGAAGLSGEVAAGAFSGRPPAARER
jgi:hypothetical protein